MTSSSMGSLDPADAVAVLDLTWKPNTGLTIDEFSEGSVPRWRNKLVREAVRVPPVQVSKKDKKVIDDYVHLEPLASQLKGAHPRRTELSSKDWAAMPAPTLTPELKKDLQLLRLRTVVDPKRHYKAADSKTLPERFQIGRVVEGPADFYSGRLTKKEQKASFADELLADSSLKSFRKRKFNEIQFQKQAGGKKFVKQKANRRRKSWAKT